MVNPAAFLSPWRARGPAGVALLGVIVASACTPADAAPDASASSSAARASTSSVAALQDVYFPGPGNSWERRSPEDVGMNPEAVQEAIEFAIASESDAPRDLLQNHIGGFGREPMGEAIGPFKERGPATGLIVRHGYIVAEWGEPDRVDPTFSVSKSFLSTTVGLAYDHGLIRDVHDRVRSYFAPVVALQGPPGTGMAWDGEGESLRRVRSAHALRVRAQPTDHLGPHAPADQRLAGRPLGQARLG